MFSRSVVFIGNPGSGKSTLVNCIAQKHLFQSGLSCSGIGVTQTLHETLHDNVRYMDTPGLSDVALRKEAASAIDSVLRQGGSFQICFVLTLTNNRICADDLTTLKLVLDAANQITENNYSIVINQMTAKQVAKLDLAAFTSNLQNALSGRVPTTNQVHFIKQYDDLTDEDDALTPLDDETTKFFTNMPVFEIVADHVKEVNAQDFDLMAQNLDSVSKDLEAALNEGTYVGNFTRGVGALAGTAVGGAVGVIGGVGAAAYNGKLSKGVEVFKACKDGGGSLGGVMAGEITGAVDAVAHLEAGRFEKGMDAGSKTAENMGMQDRSLKPGAGFVQGGA